MAPRLLSKRDISIHLYLLDNGQGRLESVMMDPQHLIRLQLDIDPHTRTVTDASSSMVIGPYALCKAVEDRAKGLIGLVVERGVMKRVNQEIGGPGGCVHLRELAIDTLNFAATAMVGVDKGFGLMDPSFARKDAKERFEMTEALLKNSCNSYSHKFEDHEKELEKLKKKR